MIDKVRTHRWWTETRAFLPLLEPAWWVMRAWLVVVVIAGTTPSDIPLPAPGGNVLLGLCEPRREPARHHHVARVLRWGAQAAHRDRQQHLC
jgi:hypothetical protein